MMKKVFVSAVIIAIVVFVACSPKTNPSSTTNNTTVEEPKPMATTYAAEVQPLILSKCTPCHVPSKGGNKAPLDNYENAKKFAAESLRRVELNPGDRGFMPFKHDKLSADEISLFKKWVADGTQEK